MDAGIALRGALGQGFVAGLTFVFGLTMCVNEPRAFRWLCGTLAVLGGEHFGDGWRVSVVYEGRGRWDCIWRDRRSERNLVLKRSLLLGRRGYSRRVGPLPGRRGTSQLVARSVKPVRGFVRYILDGCHWRYGQDIAGIPKMR